MASQVMMEAKKHTTEGSIHYRGWGVALAAFVGVMVSFAAIMPYKFSLFLEPLSPWWLATSTIYGMYQPRLIVGLALTCVAGAALSLLLPRYSEESAIIGDDLAPSIQTA